MKITAVQTDLFAEKEDLPAFILRHLPAVPQGAVLAVASKLFALWKGEIIPDTDLATKEALIRRESDFALQTPLAWLTVKDGTPTSRRTGMPHRPCRPSFFRR